MARPIDPELRHRLLAAAREVFAERGFAGATMAEIGERAGVTKGGVYFHFRSKEALFFAVFDERRTTLRAVLAKAGEGAENGAAGLQELLRSYLAFHFEDPAASRLMRVLVSELQDRFTTKLREDVATEQRQMRARVRELLGRGNHDGSLFGPDPAMTAFLLVGAVRGFVDQWLSAPSEAEPFCRADALAEELVVRYATGTMGPDGGSRVDDPSVDFHPPI